MNILEEALRVCEGDRQDSYGEPAELARRVAELWSGILGHKVEVTDVPLMMAALKIARLKVQPGHRDSLIDLAGYAYTYERIHKKISTPRPPDDGGDSLG
jgi:hypothetical protein